MRSNKGVWLALIPCVVFFCGAMLILQNGHLHEDAYILFQYSRNLAAGHGIVFDATAGPTEGATDFLWMSTLGLCRFMGLDIGVAAALLNALGLGLIAHAAWALRGRADALWVIGLACLCVSGGVAAALGGFSTLAYGGIFAQLTLSVVQRRQGLMMLLITVIALFRPDGVILGAGALVSYAAFTPKRDLPGLAKAVLVPIMIGLTYFLWRYQYFGMLLPLPLLVKQKMDQPLEGLLSNITAVAPYLPLLLAPLVGLKLPAQKLAGMATGPLLLFAALSFAHHSQNIGHRFQFPIIIGLFLIFMASAPEFKTSAWRYLACGLLPLFALHQGAQGIKWDVKYLTNHDYINHFPQILRKSAFQVDTIAISEAGRFPYWYNARSMTDVIGLNSADIVRDGVQQTLTSKMPDLIFIHHADQLGFEPPEAGQTFKRIAPADITDKRTYQGNNPVYKAPGQVLSFVKSQNYTGYLVKYGKGHDHMYFLKAGVDVAAFEKALAESFSTRMSYLQSRGSE